MDIQNITTRSKISSRQRIVWKKGKYFIKYIRLPRLIEPRKSQFWTIFKTVT